MKMGRWGWAITTALSVLVLMTLIWGYSTDWNWTSAKVIAASKAPKNGDPCTTADHKAGKYLNGTCEA